MRAAMRRALTIGATALVGCYASHERPDDAAVDVQPIADAWAGPDLAGWDGGPCGLIQRRDWPGPCTAERDLQCQRDATMLARGGYGHSACVQTGDPTREHVESLCAFGDRCPDSRLGPCQCGPRLCISSEVCVSNTADGAPYCRSVCAP